MKMNPVVHFEMSADDRERMAAFYSKVFGWKTQMFGAEMGSYVLATTTETDEASGRPKTPGAINGGFFPRVDKGPGNYPRVVIAVENIVASMKEVANAGGEVHGEPVEIPGVGQFVLFSDTEGNWVAMLQPTAAM